MLPLKVIQAIQSVVALGIISLLLFWILKKVKRKE